MNQTANCLLSLLITTGVTVAQEPVGRVLFGSCIKQERPISIFHTMANERPELILFTGDNIYADTDDMDLMRQKYATLAARPEFKKLQRVCPILATWDDHDFGINDGGADFSRRAESQQEFLDFWKVPSD